MDSEEYRRRYEELASAHDKALGELRDQYVAENAKFRVGDLVQSRFGHRVLVDKVHANVCYSPRVLPEICYSGPVMTRKGTPRKDGGRMTLSEEYLKQANQKKANQKKDK